MLSSLKLDLIVEILFLSFNTLVAHDIGLSSVFVVRKTAENSLF